MSNKRELPLIESAKAPEPVSAPEPASEPVASEATAPEPPAEVQEFSLDDIELIESKVFA